MDGATGPVLLLVDEDREALEVGEGASAVQSAHGHLQDLAAAHGSVPAR